MVEKPARVENSCRLLKDPQPAFYAPVLARPESVPEQVRLVCQTILPNSQCLADCHLNLRRIPATLSSRFYRCSLRQETVSCLLVQSRANWLNVTGSCFACRS